ncbi:MAG: glycosyltransferase family 1 protein [Bacteroidota bacterium]
MREKSGFNFFSLLPSEKKLNFNEQVEADYGKHRSGWNYALSAIKGLHNPKGVFVDSFIERTFYWNPSGIRPHREPWIGFIHVPPKVPKWFMYEMSNEYIFSTEAWLESLPYCQGLFTLSDYHRKALEPLFPFPVNHLIHPTEVPLCKWSYQGFISNRERKVIQIGYWLRKLYSIYLLPAKGYTKILLTKDDVDFDRLLKIAGENYEYKDELTPEVLQSAQRVNFLPNENYDQLLSENIIFLDLYDASANNVIIECMMRNTPLLVNPIEPVVEYLGMEYPFYFSDLEEAGEKLNDMALIRETSSFLKDHPLKKQLSGRYFRKSLIGSQIYKQL